VLNIGQPVMGVVATLFGILALVLVMPLVSRKVEENLEPFFLLMGIIASTAVYLAGILPGSEVPKLVKTALLAPVVLHGIPIGITQVVFIFGLIFYYFYRQIYGGLDKLIRRIGLVGFVIALTATLGLISSIISVIVTAVILSELVAALEVDREARIKFTVYAAFAVGLGAARLA